MESKLETLKGYYIPSFYKMHIEADCSLYNISGLAEDHLSTYFHEYIHFLQDITTTFGLINTSLVVNRLKYYNAIILQKPDKNVMVPIIVEDNDLISVNRKLQNLFLGTNNYINSCEVYIVDVQVMNSDVWVPEPHNLFPKKVVIEAIIDGQNSFFQFGGICLLESMAHIIQSAHFPKVSHKEFPYRTAELLIKYLYPDIGQKEDIILALCDISLMSSNPGLTFYNLIIDLKRRSWDGEAKELYNLLNEYEADGVDMKKTFSETIVNTLEHITSYFTPTINKEEIEWVSSLLNLAHLLRQGTPYFFLELYYGGKDYFAFLIKKLGTPLVMNISGEAWFRPPEDCHSDKIQPDRLASIYNIFELFENGIIPCDLRSFCMETVDVDERCTLAPWTRSKDATLCGFCASWLTWGLDEITPIKNI